MKLLKSGFNFYINSSIHVAFAVIALTIVTVLEYNLKVDKSLYFFVFFGTISAYNFVKYAKIAGLHHRSLTKSLKSIQLFSFLSLIIAFYFTFFIPLKVLLIAMGFGLLTFFYAVPLLNYKNLRTIGGLKIFIVGIVWAGITVFTPIVSDKMEITADCWFSFIQRSILVIVLTLPFEIRDIPYDASNLKTLPQLIGVRKVKVIGVILLGLILLIEMFKDELSYTHYLSLFLTSIIIAICLIFTKIKQAKYYASFWIEGIPIIWMLMLIYLLGYN